MFVTGVKLSGVLELLVQAGLPIEARSTNSCLYLLAVCL